MQHTNDEKNNSKKNNSKILKRARNTICVSNYNSKLTNMKKQEKISAVHCPSIEFINRNDNANSNEQSSSSNN